MNVHNTLIPSHPCRQRRIHFMGHPESHADLPIEGSQLYHSKKIGGAAFLNWGRSN